MDGNVFIVVDRRTGALLSSSIPVEDISASIIISLLSEEQKNKKKEVVLDGDREEK